MGEPLLEVDGTTVSYGLVQVLSGRASWRPAAGGRVGRDERLLTSPPAATVLSVGRWA